VGGDVGAAVGGGWVDGRALTWGCGPGQTGRIATEPTADPSCPRCGVVSAVANHTVTDNVSTGLTSLGAVKLEGSVFTGNIFIGQPADLVSRGAPHLLGTTCGTSVSLGPPPTYALGPSWGVCAND